MNGARVLFRIPILGGIPITDTIVSTWIVMAGIAVLCKVLTYGMKEKNIGTRQVLAETYVGAVYQLVEQTMGKDKLSFAPYFGTLFIFSLFSSLMGLFGLRAPTADLNTTLGWAIITFFMVQINSIRRKRVKGWLRGFTDPVPFMLPLNIISEFSNVISLAFRHFGNIAAGSVITSLVYTALAGLSTLLFNIGVPLTQIGIPAFLSIYFDLFSGVLQAFIFCMLSRVFGSMAMD